MPQPVVVPFELFRQTSLYTQVEYWVDEFAAVWKQCPTTRFPFQERFTTAQQQKRERYLHTFIHNLQSERRHPNALFETTELQERLFSQVRTFFQGALGFSRGQLNVLLDVGFKESTKAFVHQARHFDPSLTAADMFQACRNVWIMNGIQLMLGLEVKFRPSIFAYSMLYPYTDNYLDDTSISSFEKREFNDRFAQRLAGVPVTPQNSHEHAIFSLVGWIEDEWDRQQVPEVFESLLAIHQAQSKSVALLGHAEVSRDNILRISLEKGGTSVLADGYLVAGALTREQGRWLFGYGAYLQFLDDVQDLHQDALHGQNTVFTRCQDSNELESETNRAFHFGGALLRGAPGFSVSATSVYLRIMRSCIPLMLIEAVGLADDYFSSAYRRELEAVSLFRFSELRRLKNEHSPYYISMFGKLI